MPRREINGGPGRTRTFDLPIMSRGSKRPLLAAENSLSLKKNEGPLTIKFLLTIKFV